jgi:hypothetical protein
MAKKRVGFGYHVSMKRIREYQAIPIEKRLEWLYQGNLLRMSYPQEIKDLQDKFRRGEI